MNRFFKCFLCSLMVFGFSMANVTKTKAAGEQTVLSVTYANEYVREKNYYFSLGSAGLVSFDITKYMDSANHYGYWYLNLYNANNECLFDTTKDVSGVNYYRFMTMGLPAGNYRLEVKASSDGVAEASYTINAKLASSNFTETEFNDSMSTSDLIKTNVAYAGHINEYGDDDYYRFNVYEQGLLALDLIHTPEDTNGYWEVELINANNQSLVDKYVNVTATSTARVSTIGIPKGSYYIKVIGSGGVEGRQYKIKAGFTATTQCETELNGSYASADQIKLGVQYTGYLNYYGDDDYYRFTLNNQSTVNLNFQHTPKASYEFWDIKVTDYNNVTKLSKRVYMSDKASLGYNLSLPKGSYYVKIDGYNTEDEKYKLTVTDVSSPTSIKLNTSSVNLNVGRTTQLKATIAPSTAVKNVYWSTGNSKIATVSSTGVVTAKAPGKIYVYAKSKNGLVAKCIVNVNGTVAVMPSSIKLNASSINVNIGKTAQLRATITPSNAVKTVYWSTGNSKIATVSSTGVVTAKAPGKIYVYAKAKNGLVAKCIVNVPAPAVSSVKFNVKSVTMYKGNYTNVKATVSPSNANNKRVVYSSKNTSIATIDQNGRVRGVKAGKTYLYAKSINGKVTSIVVTVRNR